jgi:hypothetical protein
MSAQGSTHSCAEDDYVSRSPTSPPVSVSPNSLDTLLGDVPNLDAATLWGILGGAIGTIRQVQEAHTRETVRLWGQIEVLERQVEHYEITYPNCLDRYESNEGRAPSFYIPGPNKTTILAKWVRQLDDGCVAGFSQHQKAGEAPHVAELYLMPSYDIEDPPELLPGWFRALLIGSSPQYNVFREEVARLNDWSVLAEVKRHRTINDELGEVRYQIGVFEAQVDDLVERRQLCEARLEAGKVASQVKYLEHLAPRTPQIAKRRGSFSMPFQAGRGRPT